MTAAPDTLPRTVASGRWVHRVEEWWRGEVGPWGRVLDLVLAPAELGYRAAVSTYHRAYDRGRRAAESVRVPVISVGNISVGGAGKTPVTRWLVGELRRRGARPAVLHGGYAPDEPALHRAWNPDVPVVVGRERVVGAKRALAEGATVLVLDDGFQHRRLARDLDLVLIAAESWTARPRLLPRGPWREAPAALGRAHVVAVTRKTATPEAADQVAAEAARFAPEAALVRIQLRPAGWRRFGGAAGGAEPRGEAVAVAGIAQPRLFLANARSAGARVAVELIFPDHHDYGYEDLARIRQSAGGRAVVTTAKDAIKLGPMAPDLEIWALEQEVVVEAGSSALAALLDRLVA